MTTFAGRYDEPLYGTRGNNGNIYTITDASVTVYESDGSTVATLYTDRDKVTEGSNPTTTDSAGNLEFFADPGTYVLSISVGGEVLRTDTVVVSVDPSDVPEPSNFATALSARGARTLDAPRYSHARVEMSSPPTIGATNTSASQITNGIKWSPLTGGGGMGSTVDPDAPFLYVGTGTAKLSRYGDAFPNYNYVKSDHVTGPNLDTQPIMVQFGFDGTEMELNLRTFAQSAYRLMVDGEYVDIDVTNIPTSGRVWIPVTFAARGPKIITLETYNSPFGGIWTGPTDTIWKPEVRGPRVVVMGDSYTGGTGADNPLASYVTAFRDLRGWKHVVQSGVGGTGYLATSGGATVKFRDRVQNDVIDLAPDIVIVAGGHNDYPTYTQAQIEAEAEALFAAIRAGLPDCLLYVVGPYAEGGSDYSAVQTYLQNAADASGVVDGVVDTTTDPWFTGTGNQSTPQGDGNSDNYIWTDGVHPSQAGHDYLGYRVSEAIAALLPA